MRIAVAAAAIGAATTSGAVAQSRIDAEQLPDIDLDLQSLDLGTSITPTPSAASRPEEKPAGDKLLPKPSAPGIQLEWVGIGNGPEAPTGKSEAVTRASDLGVKMKLRPPITLGVIAQLEQAGDTSPGLRAADQNWLAAATSSVQMLPGLSLDTRTAWGPTEPDANGHEGRRRAVDVRLTKKEEVGAWRFSPSFGLNYVEERQGTAAAAADVPGAQTIGSGRFDIRPELAYRLDLQNSMFIEPKAMIGGFWDIGASSVMGNTHPDLRLKGEASVTIGSTGGTKLQIGGAVEEGAVHAPDVWTGRLRVDVPLK